MATKFPVLLKSAALSSSFLTIAFITSYHFFPKAWLLTAAISFGTTAYHFLMRLAVGYLLPKATNYDFDYRRRWFQPRSWEPAFYNKLNVKAWKGRLPTYAPGQFSLTENTLYRVIQNMCGAEIVHEIIMILSFLPVLTIPLFGSPEVFWITSLLAALFDSIFVMAQRFNRPRLVRIYEKQEANAHE